MKSLNVDTCLLLRGFHHSFQIESVILKEIFDTSYQFDSKSGLKLVVTVDQGVTASLGRLNSQHRANILWQKAVDFE